MKDTRVTGRPCTAKMVLSLLIVCEAEVELSTTISGHFDKATTATTYIVVTTSSIEHDQCAISSMDCKICATMDMLVLQVDCDSQHNATDRLILFLQFLSSIEATTKSFLPVT